GSFFGGAGGFDLSWPAGRPHLGQSQSSGMGASLAKLGRVTCILAHQNGTRTRGAASPRSASPIGPAPTRLPRIALPLPTDELLARSPRARRGESPYSLRLPGGGRSGKAHRHVADAARSGLEQQTERDDA